MLVSGADAKTLKSRVKAEQDRLAAAEAELLWAACFEVAIKLMSDDVEAYKACRSAKCRRQRRCVGRPVRCSPIICGHGIRHDVSRLIDGLYWMTLPQLANGRPLDDDDDDADQT